jgi:hypothetical protein
MLTRGFDDSVMDRTQNSEWFSRLKTEHASHPSTCRTEEYVDRFCKIANEDRGPTLLEIAGKLCLSYAIHKRIIKESLNMQRISMSSVLTDELWFSTLKNL